MLQSQMPGTGFHFSQIVLFAVLVENILASTQGLIPDSRPMFMASAVAMAIRPEE